MRTKDLSVPRERVAHFATHYSRVWRASLYDVATEHHGRFLRVQVKCTIFHRGNSYNAEGFVWHVWRGRPARETTGCVNNRGRAALIAPRHAPWKDVTNAKSRFQIGNGQCGSSEGAKECSPQRKLWVLAKRRNQPRRGERNGIYSSDLTLALR